MNIKEWKYDIIGLIDGVEKHLCLSAPKKAYVRLQEFKRQATNVLSLNSRKLFEQRLDKFLQSTPYLRAAAKRYLSPRIMEGLKTATNALIKANVILKEIKTTGRLSQKMKSTLKNL